VTQGAPAGASIRPGPQNSRQLGSIAVCTSAFAFMRVPEISQYLFIVNLLSAKPASERYVFYALTGWFVLNLLQGIFTELFHDEAYYWVFSQNLSLVYFDQMPAVAYWIKAGSSILPGEIGVRFFTVLFCAPMLYGIYKLSGVSNHRWFIALTFSLLIVHFGAFLTAPDSVLGATVVVFLFAYRNWVRNLDLKSAIVLAFAAALVCYSKYQGVLFVIMLFLANLGKWKKLAFWLPPIITIGLLLPMYLSNPVVIQETLEFHLTGRHGGQTAFELTSNFLSSQVVLLGPFVFPFLLIAMIRFRSQDYFFSSLRRGILFYYAFLFLLSFKTNVEGNWCGPAVPGILLLSIKYWTERDKGWKIAKWLLVVSLFFLLIGRVFLVWNFLPGTMERSLLPEYHGWSDWAKRVEAICGKEPVVFSNSYQLPSKYWYYSGNPSTSASNCRYRKNQYSVMSLEADWQGKPVWFAYPYSRVRNMDSVVDPYGRVYYFERFSSFCSYFDLVLGPAAPLEKMSAGDTSMIAFRFSTTDGKEKTLIGEKEGLVQIGYWWQAKNGKEFSFDEHTNRNGTIIPSQGTEREIEIIAPPEKGEYQLCVYLIVDHYVFSNNGKPIKVSVE
jgi:hypothetical protein